MITSLRELQDAKAILQECRQELLAEGKGGREHQVGTMIETPRPVLIADHPGRRVRLLLHWHATT